MLTVDVTEEELFAALGKFINDAVGGTGVELVRGLGNRVPLPKGSPIVMSPGTSVPLSTTVSTFNDDDQEQTFERSTQWSVQLDFYGAGGNDRAQLISMLLRSEYGCTKLAESAFEIQPLYAGEPKQLPLVSGEQQYVERWSFDAVLQYNPRVSVPQESAIELVADVLNVPVTYPSGD